MRMITATGQVFHMTANSRDPFLIYTREPKHHKTKTPSIPKVYPVFPPIADTIVNGTLYRIARPADLQNICRFTDFWLSGKGYREHIPGAGSDCFVSFGRHSDYIKNYTVVLAISREDLCGWAVRQRDGTLIHLLVAADYRGKGIGATFLDILKPPSVRSKSDQSTGDPLNFYLKHGYSKISDAKTGKHKNIDVLILEKPAEIEGIPTEEITLL